MRKQKHVSLSIALEEKMSIVRGFMSHHGVEALTGLINCLNINGVVHLGQESADTQVHQSCHINGQLKAQHVRFCCPVTINGQATIIHSIFEQNANLSGAATIKNSQFQTLYYRASGQSFYGTKVKELHIQSPHTFFNKQLSVYLKEGTHIDSVIFPTDGKKGVVYVDATSSVTSITHGDRSQG